MDRDFRYRTGRFIKGNNPLLKKLKIEPYSFDKLSEETVILCDNQNGSIVHLRFHGQEDIEKIQNHPSMDKEIREPQMMIPVIQPSDFTHDWRKQLERAAKRSRYKTDDDEEDSIDIPEVTLNTPSEQEVPKSPSEPAIPEPASQHELQVANLNSVAPNFKEEFVALVDTIASRESAPATSTPPLPTPPVDYQALEEDARRSGYEKGLSEAQSKLNEAIEQTINQTKGFLESMVNDLKSTQKSMNESAQENFIEIAQAIAESLIGRELSVDPAALKNLVESAAQELGGRDLTIFLHESDYERMKQIMPGQCRVDGQLTPLTFRIESSSGVIAGDFKERIKAMFSNPAFGLKVAG